MMKKHITVILLPVLLLSVFAGCKKNGVDVLDFAHVSVDSVFPAAGPSGTYVEVFGKNFPYRVTETVVTIDGKQCTVVKSSPQKLLIRIPDNARSGPLLFWFDRRNPAGDRHDYSDLLDSAAVWPSFVIDEAMIVPPIITKVGPAAGKPGTLVTLEGYNFATTAGVLKVLFGENAGELVSVNPDKVIVKVPVMAPGAVMLQVQQGTHQITTGSFTVDAVPSGTIYYIGGNHATEQVGIFKMMLDATGNPVIEKIYGYEDGVYMPYGLQVDLSGGKLYWSEDTKLMQGSIDGTTPLEVLHTDESSISDLALVNGVLYYTCYSLWAPGGNAIKKFTLGGTAETLYRLADDVYPIIIEVDAASSKLYWLATDNKVMSGSTGGTSPQELFTANELGGVATAMTIDPVTHKFYILNNNREIYSSAQDGSGVQKLAIEQDYLNIAGDLEVDPVNGFLFWRVEGDAGVVYRSKLDGAGVQIFVSVMRSVSAIEVVW